MKLKFTIFWGMLFFLSISCDTRYTMVWGDYHYAKELLEEKGDIEGAKKRLSSAARLKTDSVLTLKIEELQKKIDSVEAVRDSLK